MDHLNPGEPRSGSAGKKPRPPIDDPALCRLRVLTAAEAAAVTTVSIQGLERHRKAGTGPRFIRLGARRVGYRLADLEAWMEANAEGGKQAA